MHVSNDFDSSEKICDNFKLDVDVRFLFCNTRIYELNKSMNKKKHFSIFTLVSAVQLDNQQVSSFFYVLYYLPDRED